MSQSICLCFSPSCWLHGWCIGNPFCTIVAELSTTTETWPKGYQENKLSLEKLLTKKETVMPALLMYYWQMKLHCKLFNLNNLVKMPVTSKFSFLQTEMSNMKLSKPITRLSLCPPSQEPQTQSIQAGPQALNPLCPPWSFLEHKLRPYDPGSSVWWAFSLQEITFR